MSLNEKPDEITQEEEKKVTNEPASPEAIKSMVDYIGGFEKWPELPIDCKENVIERLSFKSRARLGICSRVNHRLVESIPWRIDGLRVCQNYVTSEVVVDIIKESPPYESHEVVFKKTENMDVAMETGNFIEMLMRKNYCTLKTIIIRFEQSFPRFYVESLPECRSATLTCETDDELKWWLAKLPANMDFLNIAYNNGASDRRMSLETFNSPQVMNCKHLYIFTPIALDVDQLLSVNSNVIKVYQANNMTETDLNKYLKQWQKGGFAKELVTFRRGFSEINQEEVLKNLDARRWDDAFRKKAGAHVDDESCRFEVFNQNVTYQIYRPSDPSESLTVSFGSSTIDVKVTVNSKPNLPEVLFHNIPLN